MLAYLVALVWPAGLVLIIGGGYLLARRVSAATGRAAPDDGPATHRAPAGGIGGTAQLIVVAVVGAAAVFGVMALLGLLVVYHGHVIDKPIWSWLQAHQVHALAALMNRLTKIGNTWTAWGASAAAAVCLAVTWRSRRWLPPAAVATLIVVDHYTTLALRHTFERLGPPTSPLGTYPSGGCDRVVVFYGLIAYLLWREFSGQRRTAIWAATVIAALAFNEAFSRVYLGLHWFTDAFSGVLYGGLLLTVFITAIQVATGRVTVPFPRRHPVRPSARAVADAHLAGGATV
jgi:membrane-associated phospholipid phosphatase